MQVSEGCERVLVDEVDVVVCEVQELKARVTRQRVSVQLLQLVVAEVQDLKIENKLRNEFRYLADYQNRGFSISL